MSITSVTCDYAGGRSWRFTAVSSLPTPTYYWRVDGARWHSGPEDTVLVPIDDGTPTVWVSDDGWGSDDEHFPGRQTLQVFIDEDSSPAYAYLRIDEYVSGSWTERKRLTCDGRGWYTWTSRYLEDVTVHQFRVVPVGENGNEGTPASFAALMVRHPSPPAVSHSYDENTGKVTVT